MNINDFNPHPGVQTAYFNQRYTYYGGVRRGGRMYAFLCYMREHPEFKVRTNKIARDYLIENGIAEERVKLIEPRTKATPIVTGRIQQNHKRYSVCE